MSYIEPGSQEERAIILKMFGQNQNTADIGKLIRQPECHVERMLHIALDKRRLVRGSLSHNA